MATSALRFYLEQTRMEVQMEEHGRVSLKRKYEEREQKIMSKLLKVKAGYDNRKQIIETLHKYKTNF